MIHLQPHHYTAAPKRPYTQLLLTLQNGLGSQESRNKSSLQIMSKKSSMSWSMMVKLKSYLHFLGVTTAMDAQAMWRKKFPVKRRKSRPRRARKGRESSPVMKAARKRNPENAINEGRNSSAWRRWTRWAAGTIPTIPTHPQPKRDHPPSPSADPEMVQMTTQVTQSPTAASTKNHDPKKLPTLRQKTKAPMTQKQGNLNMVEAARRYHHHLNQIPRLTRQNANPTSPNLVPKRHPSQKENRTMLVLT